MTTATVSRLVRAQQAVEGDGFVVRRPFPTPSLSYLDPFLLFDHMGPVEFAAGKGVGTPWHPHRGFETVTYLLEGDMEHRDSMGNHGSLRSGDTQWMTAASGVLHKEGPSAVAQETGGRVHGLQLWVNLPSAQKMDPPAYQDLRATANARREQPGAVVRVIAGELFDLPGAVRVGDTQVDEGILAIVDGDDLTVQGVASSSEVVLLTGEPIGEPVARYGPFVMNTEQELRDAFRDFERGAFGVPLD
jgi:redox-sensitive bicupin YhaK (pirin superfamily)